MESKWLDDFLAVASCRNFSRAASSRHVTQSALSRRIRQLEDWIGVELVDRGHLPIRLTPAAEGLLPRIEALRAQLQDLRQTASPDPGEGHGRVTVAMMGSIGSTWFPELTARMRAKGHDFRIRFAEPRARTIDSLQALRDRSADFALLYAHDHVVHPERDDELEHLVLGHDRAIAVSAPDAGGRARHALRPTGGAVDHLGYCGQSFFAQALPHLHRDLGLRLNTIYESALCSSLLAGARRGIGVAWLPRSLVADDLRAGHLVPAGPPASDLVLELRIWRARRPQAPHKERFWRLVRALAPLEDAGLTAMDRMA